MTQNAQILCARCRVALEGPAELNPDDRVACPRCGEGDRFETVMSEVRDYVAEMAAKKLATDFGEIGKPGDFITARATYTPSGRQWRFVAEVEL